MGLFDFWKDKGEDVIESDAEAAANIQQHIEASNPGVEGLQVSYSNGVVELSGQAESAEAMEKAVLLAGNIEGVEEVKASGLSAPPAEGPVEYYTIESGDTLSKLAKKYYGDPMQYPKIFKANKEVIKDPDLIYPGQKIRIPTGM